MTKDSKSTLTDKMIRARTIAQSKLATYAKSDPSECKEVYLFNKDQFCGIRFSLGPFHATWQINDLMLNIVRGEHRLDQVAIDTESQVNRAA